MLALALLLLLRVIRSFFALSESPVTNSLDSILPTARSFVNCNWKLEKTLFLALFGLPKTRVLRCAIQGKQENGCALLTRNGFRALAIGRCLFPCLVTLVPTDALFHINNSGKAASEIRL